GIAQEKASAWRSWIKGQERSGRPHTEWGRQMTYVNPLLLVPVGSGLGEGFLEDQRLLPVPRLALAQRARVGQAAVGEGRRRVRGTRQRLPFLCRPHALQRICDRLGPGAVENFFWRWFWRLPLPLRP